MKRTINHTSVSVGEKSEASIASVDRLTTIIGRPNNDDATSTGVSLGLTRLACMVVNKKTPTAIVSHQNPNAANQPIVENETVESVAISRSVSPRKLNSSRTSSKSKGTNDVLMNWCIAYMAAMSGRPSSALMKVAVQREVLVFTGN